MSRFASSGVAVTGLTCERDVVLAEVYRRDQR